MASASSANHPGREIQAYVSGYSSPDQAGMRAVTCHQVEIRPDGTAWLWLDDLSHLKKDNWTAEDYIFAARQVGLFNGASPECESSDMDWIDRSGTSDRRRFPGRPGRVEFFEEAAPSH